MSNFLDTLRNDILRPRFNALMDHGEEFVKKNFDEISIRMLWYNTVDRYKAKFGTDVIDLTGEGSKQYKRFESAISDFCAQKSIIGKAKQKDPRYGAYWGILRKALNIDAKGRAVIYGCTGDNILVVPENKPKYLGKGLFAVICEKETLGKKFLADMKRRGWGRAMYLIITAGFSTCEVIETLMDEKASIDDGSTQFHVGILHDCDIPGHMITWDIKKQFPEAIDFGINFEMLDGYGTDIWNSYKEACKVDKDIVQGAINAGLLDIVTHLGNWKLELDNLYERGGGIKGFCDYAERQIEKYITKVDLNRVEKPTIDDPDDLKKIREQINTLWKNICIKAIGKEDEKVDWTQPADEEMERMIEENTGYEPENLEALRHYSKYIKQQSEDLQKIINEDPDNVKQIEQIQDVLDQSGILEAIDKLVNDKIEIKDGLTMLRTQDTSTKPNDKAWSEMAHKSELEGLMAIPLPSGHAQTDQGSMPALELAPSQVETEFVDKCPRCHKVYPCIPGQPCKTCCGGSTTHERNPTSLSQKLKENDEKRKREEDFKKVFDAVNKNPTAYGFKYKSKSKPE